MNIAVIIVSWNVRELLRRCIETVRSSLAGSEIGCRLVVVDNDSHDGTAAMLRADYPDVELLEAGRNLGYAGGNNLALRRVLDDRPAEGRPPGHSAETPDYVLILNPDTEIVGDAIPQLAAYLESHRDVALVGPQLRYPDGSIQPTRRRFPSPAVFFWESTPLEQLWPANPWARYYRFAETAEGAEGGQQEVDWLVGAALLVRRTAIEQAGLLDAGFALYSEELEWQRRIRARSGRIVYLPEAVIIHHEGRSSSQVPARRLIAFHKSRLRYVRMAFGGRLARVVRRFLQLAYGAELLIEGGKWLIGHRRAMRAERVTTYRALLRALRDDRSADAAP